MAKGKRKIEEIIVTLEKEVKAADDWPMITSRTKELRRVLKYVRKLEKKQAKKNVEHHD